MRTRFTVPVFLLCACLQPDASWAQSPSSSAGRVELAFGAGWIGPIRFSTPDANELDRDGESFRLFTVRGEMAPVVSFGGRFSVRLTDLFEIETGVSYAMPDLIVRVDDDVEDADSIDVRETLKQIRVQGGLVANLRRASPDRRNVPFVTVGAGYLRELHEGQTLAGNGQEYFVGAGLKHSLRSSQGSRLKAVGVRLDARMVLRVKGVALDDKVHFIPVLGGSLFLRF